jgi:hypothetical protein
MIYENKLSVSIICYFISTSHVNLAVPLTGEAPQHPVPALRASESVPQILPCLATMMDAQPNTMHAAKNHSRPPDATRPSSCHHGLRRRGHLPVAFPSALSSSMQCPCRLSHGVYSGLCVFRIVCIAPLVPYDF